MLLLVNGKEIAKEPISGGVKFNTEVILKSGEDQIIIKASDSFGNIGSKIIPCEPSEPIGTEPPLMTLGKYYALLIAVEDYSDPQIAMLDRPVKDAESIKEVLIKNYTFEEEKR